MNPSDLALAAVVVGLVLFAAAAGARQARRAGARRLTFAPPPDSGYAPAEWLYATTSASTPYPTLAAAQAACAASASCVGVATPLTPAYLAGAAPAVAYALKSMPTVGPALVATPIAFYARAAAAAPAAPYAAQTEMMGVSAADPLTCAGSSLANACVLPSRGLGERACDSLPECLGYVRAVNTLATGDVVGEVQLYSAPLVPTTLAQSTVFEKPPQSSRGRAASPRPAAGRRP